MDSVHTPTPINKNSAAGFCEEMCRQRARKTSADKIKCELRNHSYNVRLISCMEMKNMRPDAEPAFSHVSGVLHMQTENVPQHL